MTTLDRSCRAVRGLIDELVDGSLDEARARAVRAHLGTCADCAAQADATRSLIDAAARLGGGAAPSPPDRLWAAIDTRLVEDEARRGRPSPLFWWWHAWRRTIFAGGGGLAAAAVLVVLWVGGSRRPLIDAVATMPRPPVSADEMYEQAVDEIGRAESDYVTAIEELRRLAGEEREHWSPEAAHAFDANLAVIDAAIASQAKAFQGAPEDPAAAEALHATYRRKIDFLQEAIVRGQLQ